MRKILHIGTHKTATTSLQTALYDNREALAEQGVIFPDLTRWEMRQRAGHHKLAKALVDDPVSGAELTRTILADAQASARPGDTLLISSEQYYRHTLTLVPQDTLKDRRENFVRLMADTFGRDTEVVIVLRRPDSFCESRHQERVKKTPYTKKVSEYATDPDDAIGFDYAFQIKLLQAYFDKVTVLIFEQIIRDEDAGGPELAFMKALGLDVTFPIPPQRLNESLHPYMVDYKRIMNHQYSPETGTLRDFKILLALQQQGAFDWINQKMTFWSEPDRRAFLDSCQPGLDWIAETFPHLRRPDGNLFPPVGALPPHVTGMPIEIFEEILAKFVAEKSAGKTPKQLRRARKKHGRRKNSPAAHS